MKIKTMCKEAVNGQDIPRRLIFDGKTLVIQTPCAKAKDTIIPVEAIQSCKYGARTEIVSKKKSVVARALLGSMFGVTGAIVGGMSGMGEKKKRDKIYYFSISYRKGGAIKQRIFDNYPTSKTYKIAKALNDTAIKQRTS